MNTYTVEMQDYNGNVIHLISDSKALFEGEKNQFQINADVNKAIQNANKQTQAINESLLQTNENLTQTNQNVSKVEETLNEKADIRSIEQLNVFISKVEENIIPPANTTKYRYVRVSAQDNSKSGNYISFSEVKVFNGALNIAKGCDVSLYKGSFDTGKYSNVTDGKTQAEDPSSELTLNTVTSSQPEVRGGVIIDLGVPQTFQKIQVFLWYGENRYYRNVIVEVSSNKTDWLEVYNNSSDAPSNYMVETPEGRTIDMPNTTIMDVQKYNDYCFSRMNDNRNNPNILRVGTFNIHGDNYLNYDEYKDYISKNLLHVIGMQETEGGEYILNNKFNNYDLNRTSSGRSSTVAVYNTLQTNRRIQEEEKWDLPGTGEGRLVHKIVIYQNGKKVAIYNTHLSFTETANRPVQLQRIKEIMDADPTPYKILTGDFNASDGEFFNIMKPEYTSVQGYNGQWYETCFDDLTFYSIDNIFVTKNIMINKTTVNKNMMGSDHRMLWSELYLN